MPTTVIAAADSSGCSATLIGLGAEAKESLIGAGGRSPVGPGAGAVIVADVTPVAGPGVGGVC